jgi:hypothetical protein
MQSAEINVSATEYDAELHLTLFSLTDRYETVFSYTLIWNTSYVTVQICIN